MTYVSHHISTNPASTTFHLRTYRLFPLIVGFALVFGLAAPTVLAACTMPPGNTQESDEMPRHETGDVPCGLDLSEAHLPCCKPDATPSSFATLLSTTGQRLSTPPVTDTQLSRIPVALVSVTQCDSRDMRARAPSITSTPLRQALLAMFLI